MFSPLVPARALMDSLKTAHKMVLISLVFLIPLVVSVAILVSEGNAEVQSIQSERDGLQYVKALRQLAQHIPEHRGMTNAFLNGNAGIKTNILAKRDQIKADVAAMDALDAEYGETLATRSSWAQLNSELQRLLSEAFDGSAPEVFTRHSELIEKFQDHIKHASIQSELTFTDSKQAFYMVALVTEQFPVMTDVLGIMRGMGSGIAAVGTISEGQKSRLAELHGEAVGEMKLVNYNLGEAVTHDPELGQRLQDGIRSMREKSKDFLHLIDTELLQADSMTGENNELMTLMSSEERTAGHVTVDSNQVFEIGTAAIKTYFGLLDTLIAELEQNLEQRQSALQAQRLTLVIGATAAIAFALLLFGGFYLSILSAVKGIQQGASKLAGGDLTARVQVSSRDELADIGQAFNTAAESFSKVLADFDHANQLLTRSVSELNAVAAETGKGAVGQADQTEMVASSMNEMSSTVHEVARNAANTAEATGSARNQAVDGGRRIGEMIREITDLSGEVSRAADVVQTLDKDVENISSVLEVIRGISEQTNLLALNAAIEAARAGEHGRGFAVVADEVRGLAGRTQDATAEIQQMIERLQAVAQEATAVMKKNSEKTQATTENASQAEAVLNGIIQAVETIDDMSTQIASAAEEQSMVAEEINRNLVEIKSVVDTTATGVKQTAARCDELESVANSLKQKIGRFKF